MIKNSVSLLLVFTVITSCQKDISFSGTPLPKDTDSTFFIRADDHVLGNKDSAAGVLMMYIDSESPVCREFYYILKGLITEYKDSSSKFALVVRHFPMDTVRNHHRARVEALAAECIAYQKHDSIFFLTIEDFFSTFLSDNLRLETVAAKYGVLGTEFWNRMTDPFFKLKIEGHIIEGIKNNFRGAPTTFLVNREGKLFVTIEGKRTLVELKQIIKPFL